MELYVFFFSLLIFDEKIYWNRKYGVSIMIEKLKEAKIYENSHIAKTHFGTFLLSLCQILERRDYFVFLSVFSLSSILLSCSVTV